MRLRQVYFSGPLLTACLWVGFVVQNGGAVAYAQSDYLVGWFDNEAGIHRLSAIGKSKAKIVMPYNSKWFEAAKARKYLDEAHRNGLTVILDCYTRPEWNIPSLRLTDIARATKGHPALAGYYIADEPEYSLSAGFGTDTTRKVDYIRLQREAVKAGNSDAVFWMVFANEVKTEYLDRQDNVMVDYYPGWTDPQADVFHKYVRRSWLRWREASAVAKKYGRRFYPVGLAFHLPNDPKNARHLTREEMRYHFFTGVVANSDGFLFYKYNSATSGYREMVGELFSQMQQLGPAVVRGVMNDPSIVISVGSEKVVYRYGVDPTTGMKALVAVNVARWQASDNDGEVLANVQFTVPQSVKEGTILVDGEGRTLALTSSSFVDNFSPFQVHIYTWY